MKIVPKNLFREIVLQENIDESKSSPTNTFNQCIFRWVHYGAASLNKNWTSIAKLWTWVYVLMEIYKSLICCLLNMFSEWPWSCDSFSVSFKARKNRWSIPIGSMIQNESAASITFIKILIKITSNDFNNKILQNYAIKGSFLPNMVSLYCYYHLIS